MNGVKAINPTRATVRAMDSFFALPSFRRSSWSLRARAALASASLLLAVGCSEAGGGDDVDAAVAPPVLPGSDSSIPFVPPTTVVPDASAPIIPGVDAGPRPVSPTPTPTNDAGPINTGTGDAGANDAGLSLPDLGSLFPPAPDAGASQPANDAGTKPGVRDPNGPCKDLNLICFDFVDMFLFNAECSTCNGGKGCQGCAIPYAY